MGTSRFELCLYILVSGRDCFDLVIKHDFPFIGFVCYLVPGNREIVVTLFWYDNGSIKSREKILSIRTVKDEWRRVESIVTIPENIHSMGMGIRTQSYQGYMLFDDMSMVLKESGPDISPVPEAPDN